MSAPALMLIAWLIELGFGWPNWLYQRVKHPVVWFGALVSLLDRALNRPIWSHRVRYFTGMLSTLTLVSGVTASAVLLTTYLPNTWWGFAIEAIIASSLLASRSLYAHVQAVATPLLQADLEGARVAVAQIVGRDPQSLDHAGIARAGIESLAENASDGVIAPLFWGALFGLPGLVAYKAINTLDSMIGHRDPPYTAYGGFAARLDDVANLVPARLTGLLFAAASLKASAFSVMFKDAPQHRSPNAGWPEAAMAGALGVRLSGPRIYGDHTSDEPWLNGGANDPSVTDMKASLSLYIRAMMLAGVGLVLLSWRLSA